MPNFLPAQSQLSKLFFGFFGFLVFSPLLFWNEQRAVIRYDALKEGESQVITIDSFDPSNNGKLVHFTFNLFNGGSNLTDSTFGIKCLNADCLMLQRSTEKYQCDQNPDESCRSEWFNFPVGNGRKITNLFRFPSQNFIANPMMAGAYELPSEIVHYVIQSRSPIDVSVDQISDATLQQEATATNFDGFRFGTGTEQNLVKLYTSVDDINDERISFLSPSTFSVDQILDAIFQKKATATYFGGFRFGNGTEQNPDIGDERISFLETRPSEISVVGVQRGKTVKAFVSESGKGGGILIYKTGNFSSAELFEMENEANRASTIALRVAGVALLIYGHIQSPSFGSEIDNFETITIAVVLYAITIGIAWLIYRPIVLGSSLAVIGLCAFGLYMLRNRYGNGNNNYHNNNNNNNDNNGPSNVDELEYDVVEAVVM